jgi:signal transduction histidine kinase
MNPKRYIIMIPIITAVVGAIILAYGYWERQKVVEELKLLFTAHVESVAAAVKEGADEAATSTALMYELTEEHLLTTAHLLSVLEDSETRDAGLVEDEDWRVRLVLKKDEAPTGDWGDIPEKEKAAFLERVLKAEPGEMVDDGEVGELGLLCLYHVIREGAAVICRDAERLSELRRETGIGPLLKGVVQREVLYAALQDSDGVLAVAPSTELISKWDDDPDLEACIVGENRAGASRMRRVNGIAIFEGLTPFEMADESLVVLRVGIDASTLIEIQENSKKRYATMVVLVVGIFLFVVLFTWMAWRWQSRREEIEIAMSLQEEEKKHWETIGQMAATVAHEVRNPLNTVNMAAQRLGREFSIAEKERVEFDEMVSLLQAEAKRVGRVVTEFLDLGKPIALNVEMVEAEQAVAEACSALVLRAESEGKELALENDCKGQVELDMPRFRQMMTNIIDNALDAVPSGGKVCVRAVCSENGLNIEVSDNGPGLTGEQASEVMKPFVSFKSTGTGLGLPLVKRLTEAHGGTFELTSETGKGTKARIFILASPKQKSRNTK